MPKTRIKKFISAPLSDKVLFLRHFYWRLKTRLYYRLMFRRLGRESVIYRPMLISNADCIEIAERVTIWDGVRLEAVRDPYGRIPSLTIGSNTNIEQDVHIVCHSRVNIGKDVSITGHCAIVDVTHPYQNIYAGKIGSLIADDDSFVEVGDGAFIGYGAVVLPNVRIGNRAVIGANSVVTHDIPDFAVAVGQPAKVVKIYSEMVQPVVEKQTQKVPGR